MSMAEILVEGATATVIGMGIVFGVLALLAVILSFFKYLNPQEKAAQTPKQPDEVVLAETPDTGDVPETTLEQEPQYESTHDGNELIAVISAAIAACVGEEAQYVIRSVKQVKPAGAYKAWNVAAIRENHRGLY